MATPRTLVLRLRFWRIETPAAWLVAFSACLGGCQTPQPAGPQPSPATQRIQAAYADLQSGRFIILANFESAEDARLFRILRSGVPVADEGQPTVTVLHSRPNTGAGGLSVRLERPADVLWLDGRRSESAALVRDWTSRDLLLVNIEGPETGAILEFSVVSGQTDDAAQRDESARPALTFSRTLTIQPGWNLLRIDLAEVGEVIDLADVRGVSWRAPHLTSPLELYFDDLVLAENTRDVLARPEQGDGMYAFQRGRRIHVGAAAAPSHANPSLAAPAGSIPANGEKNTNEVQGARFELAFADGVIAGLFGGSNENLTVASGMGPWPIPLSHDWAADGQNPPVYDDPELFAAWGTQVAAGQRLIEASHFRVVLEGEWRYQSAARDPAAASAGHHPPVSDRGQTTPAAELPGNVWRYTIYPSGQVYVLASSNPAALGWPAPLRGVAIALDARRGFNLVQPTVSVSGPPVDFALLARSGPRQTDVLWVPADPRLAANRLTAVSDDERRMALIAGVLSAPSAPADFPGRSIPADASPAAADSISSTVVSPAVEFAQLIRIWPPDIDGPGEAESLAGDYQNPARIAIATGERVVEAAGDLNADGYNESEGCYELRPARAALRFTFDPAGRIRHQPVFRVHDTAAQRCWVYADGRIVRHTGRDVAGRLLFVLPHAITRPVLIEVLAKPE